MFKSSIFKLCITKYITIYIFVHNLGYVEVLSEIAIKSVNIIVCIPYLVFIKYFGNKTIGIKIIVFTYPDLLPSALANSCPILMKL